MDLRDFTDWPNGNAYRDHGNRWKCDITNIFQLVTIRVLFALFSFLFRVQQWRCEKERYVKKQYFRRVLRLERRSYGYESQGTVRKSKNRITLNGWFKWQRINLPLVWINGQRWRNVSVSGISIRWKQSVESEINIDKLPPCRIVAGSSDAILHPHIMWAFRFRNCMRSFRLGRVVNVRRMGDNNNTVDANLRQHIEFMVAHSFDGSLCTSARASINE